MVLLAVWHDTAIPRRALLCALRVEAPTLSFSGPVSHGRDYIFPAVPRRSFFFSSLISVALCVLDSITDLLLLLLLLLLRLCLL